MNKISFVMKFWTLSSTMFSCVFGNVLAIGWGGRVRGGVETSIQVLDNGPVWISFSINTKEENQKANFPLCITVACDACPEVYE